VDLTLDILNVEREKDNEDVVKDSESIVQILPIPKNARSISKEIVPSNYLRFIDAFFIQAYMQNFKINYFFEYQNTFL